MSTSKRVDLLNVLSEEKTLQVLKVLYHEAGPIPKSSLKKRGDDPRGIFGSYEAVADRVSKLVGLGLVNEEIQKRPPKTNFISITDEGRRIVGCILGIDNE